MSNLQLDVSKLPANFFAGEQLKVDVSFIEDGNRVTNSDFLSLLDIQLQLKTEEGKSASKSMSDPKNPPTDGVFSESITKLSKVGQYEVTVLVDGKTFKRSKRQVVNLRAPFDFEFSVKSCGAEPFYELVVTPLNESISLDETTIFVKTKFPDNTSLISALEMEQGSNRWILQIPPDKGDGVYEVAVKVKSKTNSGQDFQFKPKPFEAEFPIPVGSSNRIVSVNEEIEEVNDYVLLDMHVGVTGWICDERRGQSLRQAVRHIPLDRIMLETDAPYLLPRDVQTKPVEKNRNEPYYLPHIAKSVAKYMEVDEAKLITAAFENSCDFFKIV